MLGKLIKHEWKSTYKVGCLMLGVLALITFLGWLSFQTPMWTSLSSGGGRFGWLDIFGIFTLIMYVMLLVVVNFGIVIYIGVHFYKTMYTDEGYLLHTLPVTKHEILFSKILVGSLWVLGIILAMYLSILLLGMSMVSSILPEYYTLAEFWREFRRGMGDSFALAGVDLNAWFLIAVFTTLLAPAISLTTLFGAISIGQLASKYRVMTAIFTYVGILVAESIVASIVRSIMTFNYVSSFGDYVDKSALCNFLVRLLVAVGLYFLSWHITSKKLNMD